MNNILLFVVESLGHYRAYLPSTPPEHQLTEIFKFAEDATTFHKCISVSNSSWMSTSAILLGNDMCYQHNTAYEWGFKYSQTTTSNKWSDPLFHILKHRGYVTASFSSPRENATGFRLYLFDLINGNGDRIASIFGDGANHFCADKEQQHLELIKYIKANKSNRFAAMSWSYLDHIAVGGNNTDSKTKGPMGRMHCFKSTSNMIGQVITTLKQEGL